MAIAASRPLDMPRQQAFWLLHLAGWSAYFAQGCLYAVAHGKPSGYWVVPATAATMGALVTLGLRFVLRSYWNLPPRRLLALMIPLVLASSAAIDFVTREALVDFCETCRPTTRLEFVAYSLGYIYVVLAWVGAYMGIKYYRQLQGETERALAARSMAHQAQLKMLRYQLNPHFLFNTLNAISTLVLERETEGANRMVTRLSSFLRYSLDNDPMQKVTLRQEIEALKLYLDIEKVRFEERLRLELDIEPEAEGALIPSLLLQPLVENAIKYAIARSETGGCLRIAARVFAGELLLELSDDGPGAALVDGEIPSARGVGLRNTRERLQALYGNGHSFRLGNTVPHGLTVNIRIPCQKEQGK